MALKRLFLIHLLLMNIIYISCSTELIQLELNLIKQGSLKNNEYDYYVLSLPEKLEEDNHLIIELEPNSQLDSINNIISDPNLYISILNKNPNENLYTWKSERFGDEIISINPSYLSPKKEFYISVHCKSKCNYILKAQLIKDIILKNDEMNVFSINPKTVTKFSFKVKDNLFKELYVNVIGSYINSFKVYLAKENPSSSNTLIADPILFNGYRFTIKNDNKILGSNMMYNLIVDNENEVEEIKIWIQYDNENILIKEADILYDSIEEKKAHCYYYPLDSSNIYKGIIISSNLFNGEGFIYIHGFNQVNANNIKKNYKDNDYSYSILLNKAIKLTSEDIKSLEKRSNEIEKNYLHFCYFAENNSSLSMKIYFLENYKKFQALNIIYPGIGSADIIPNNSYKKYRLEYFNIEEDISCYLFNKNGKNKLYLYLAKLDEEDSFFEKNFEVLQKNDQIIEAKTFSDISYIVLTKEKNKCLKNPITEKHGCTLNLIVKCFEGEDCNYNIYFDHSKKTINMKPKQIYTNVISESEEDLYKITITDPSVKNFAVVLMQNSGQTLLRCDYFITERNAYDLNEEKQNKNFLPNLLKISTKLFNSDNLLGTFSIKVRGLSYASYSIYYYTFNEEENEEQLDQEKVSMKLTKGKIIRDIFMDNHRFKVYMYDTSTIGNKTDLYIGLVETDYTNLELYIFKDLNDFSFNKDNINGYIWKGDYRDYIYINKKDKKYIDNDVLYIMVYKSINYRTLHQKIDSYTSFYLGITDETTPLLLTEGIEFKHRLNMDHTTQIFNYYYMLSEKSDNTNQKQDIQISLGIYYGHIIIKIFIENQFYLMQYLKDESNLILIKHSALSKNCKDISSCEVNIEVLNDDSYLLFSSFLISIKSELNTPIILKPGVVNKRSILSGEKHHFIVDLKPEKFGAKITSYFIDGYGDIYARRLLRSEMFQKTEDYHFPDEDFYEYTTNYKNNDFNIIEIPYQDFQNHSYFRLLLTVKGTSPNYYTSKIEYTISISNSINEILIEKNYKMFISQGEINFFHFKVEGNKKRLYISMTDKDQDANMYLSYDKYNNNLNEYQWKNIGAFNEYIDLSINDPFFASRSMDDLDGDYYLAIQGKDDTFYNLYISSQDVKIITLEENRPAGCTCESENDQCFFRYENLKSPSVKNIYKKKIIFYPEFTYGSGVLYAKLYKNGNMDDIMRNLPNAKNNDANNEDNYQFLFMNLEEDNPKFTYNSVILVAMQCKQKSLFDLSAALLDKKTDVSRNTDDNIYLRLNRDNIFYLSSVSGLTSKFTYYIYNNIDLNFQIKALIGKINVHSYTNDTTKKAVIEKDKNSINYKNYHHIADFALDTSDKIGKKEFNGKIPKEYGFGNFIFFEIKPEQESLINININYNDYMTQIPLNKETITSMKNFNCFAYFEFNIDIDEVILSITSLDKDYIYNVYLKINIINMFSENKIEEQSKLSKPSKYNYDIQGKTNPLTSTLSLRVKNVPKTMRNSTHSTIVLINMESAYYSNDKKIKINVSPIMNNILRIKPEQKKYYFSELEKKNSEKAVFTLKNNDGDNNLMIIEISSCKGNFLYALTDFPPLDNDNYKQLKEKSVPSEMYSSNGKKIITVRNLQVRDYYLILFGSNEENNFDIIINDNKNISSNNKNENNNDIKEVDVLFFYYTINEKNYNYLVTQDNIKYESRDDFYTINFILPETKKRDIFGKENSAKEMNYFFIITDNKNDFNYMESTCYLTKLHQKDNNKKFEKIEIKFDENKKIFKIIGLEGGKEYYMNILAKNEKTGEVITYKPVKIVASVASRRLKVFLTIFLAILFIVFLYMAFTVYRKYRVKRIEMNYIEDQNMLSPRNQNKNIGKLKNINLDFVKKKYNQLGEDSQELNA